MRLGERRERSVTGCLVVAEQDGAGRSRTERWRLQRTDGCGGLCDRASSALVLLPEPSLYSTPSHRQVRVWRVGGLVVGTVASEHIPLPVVTWIRSVCIDRANPAAASGPTLIMVPVAPVSRARTPAHDAGPSPCDACNALNRARMSGASFNSHSGCNSASTKAQSSRRPMRSTMPSISAQSRRTR